MLEKTNLRYCALHGPYGDSECPGCELKLPGNPRAVVNLVGRDPNTIQVNTVGFSIDGFQFCLECVAEDRILITESAFPIHAGDPDWAVGSIPICCSCGCEIETATEATAVELEDSEKVALVKAYVKSGSFGLNKFAVFEVVDGRAILRAASPSRNTASYLEPGRIFVNLESQEYSLLKLV